jgi:hypothetical protein
VRPPRCRPLLILHSCEYRHGYLGDAAAAQIHGNGEENYANASRHLITGFRFRWEVISVAVAAQAPDVGDVATVTVELIDFT